MTLEATAAKATQDTIRQGVRTTEALLKKAWSILDAATEKKSPSEYLSPKAIAAIQGKQSG